MKNIFKLATILCVILIIVTVYCYAAPKDYTGDTTTAATQTKDLGDKITGAIQAGGIIISVAVLSYVGIRFMIASPSEKANLKGALIPYIVGAVIVFTSTTLVTIIWNLRL